MTTQYKVYMTPLTNYYTYGTEVEVTKYIEFSGIPVIKQAIDSTDYDVGNYFYGDIQLKAINQNGYFNDESDTRSIFKFSRDRSKVRVVFSNASGDTIFFKGLINEEATRSDPQVDAINFRVLSQDSVIRNTQIAGGTIANGSTCKNAFASLLNVPSITSVLNFSLSNINPSLNFTIDDGTKFDNISTRDGLNNLLLASNSVLVIDSSDNLIVKTRAVDTTKAVLNLYGPYDIQGRGNVIDLSGYNTGRHRMFTSFMVNSQSVEDNTLAVQYGFRQKSVTLDFITSTTTATTIANNLLTEFKAPKIELMVTIPSYLATGVAILDRVSLNYPYRISPVAGGFYPMVGITTVGQSNSPVPNSFGSLRIDSNLAFKVIEIDQDPSSFETTLKLRQTGTTLSDGIINGSGNAIIGFAIVGEAILQTGTDDGWNPSVIGAAQVSATKVA